MEGRFLAQSSVPDTLLARTFHEDALQAHQLVSWRGFVDFDPAGNAVG
ncbi:MAG: hypothetical protein ACI87O_000725, partial [Planctomycetota bacterium]